MNTTQKYKAYPALTLPDRKWPDSRIEKPPIWCSVDLRDGNQALINPMNLEQKINLFKFLVEIGFKEIEVGFPAASEIEFEFVRHLIEHQLIPDDVYIQVLTQARQPLIEKTFASLQGCSKAILHLYNSTSTAQRKTVFNTDVAGVTQIACQGVEWVRQCAENTDTEILLQYSPESFTGTEPEVALAVCSAVIKKWGLDKKIIINLPSTVELSLPNQFADYIEWMAAHLPNREAITLSIHTHNDRGTGVAASELGLLAGAQRIEGTLLGNGERTGNVDIVTLALNLFTQGIDPKLDIYDIPKLTQIVEQITAIPTHPRHPYAGELVFTAFSGSHQDAIKKGMNAYQKNTQQHWEVPYLTIDPSDINRSYKELIRINAQSGKGGIAYILEQNYGIRLPKNMQIEFSKTIQKIADEAAQELQSDQIWEAFESRYLKQTQKLNFEAASFQKEAEDCVHCTVNLSYLGKNKVIQDKGNGPIDAVKKALTQLFPSLTLSEFNTHSLEQGSSSRAIAYIQVCLHNNTSFGAGIDTNTNTAAIKALFSAINLLI